MSEIVEVTFSCAEGPPDMVHDFLAEFLSQPETMGASNPQKHSYRIEVVISYSSEGEDTVVQKMMRRFPKFVANVKRDGRPAERVVLNKYVE